MNRAARRITGATARGHRIQARTAKVRTWALVPGSAVVYLAAAAAAKSYNACRFYVHGDQSEMDPGLFYCGHSFQFKPFGHFMHESEKSRLSRYAMDNRFWEKLSKRSDWHRPAAPENIVNPPGPNSVSARLHDLYWQSRLRYRDWITTMPPAACSLDKTDKGPAYDLKFPEYPRRADIERDLNRILRRHGIQHLKKLKSRLREDGDTGTV
jgi:hypothetical protein